MCVKQLKNSIRHPFATPLFFFHRPFMEKTCFFLMLVLCSVRCAHIYTMDVRDEHTIALGHANIQVLACIATPDSKCGAMLIRTNAMFPIDQTITMHYGKHVLVHSDATRVGDAYQRVGPLRVDDIDPTTFQKFLTAEFWHVLLWSPLEFYQRRQMEEQRRLRSRPR